MPFAEKNGIDINDCISFPINIRYGIINIIYFNLTDELVDWCGQLGP